MKKGYKLVNLESLDLSSYKNVNQLEENLRGKVSRETLDAILFPHKTKDWVIYLEGDNKSLIPHYNFNNVKEILSRHGIGGVDIPVYAETIQKTSPSTFIKEGAIKRRVRRDEFVIDIEGEKYARAIHWANEIPFNKARLSQLLNHLESSEPEKYRDFVEIIEGTKGRKGRHIYLSEKGMQYLIDVEPHFYLKDSSIPISKGSNNEEYQSSYFWKESLFEKTDDRNYALSESKFFYQILSGMQSYIKNLENLEFRSYHKNSAEKAKEKTEGLLGKL